MPQLYAIASTLERARFFLASGVPVVQLRCKGEPLAPHTGTLRAWVREFAGSRIVVNDDLDVAQAIGAWGVHLGQEDLQRYPRERILNAGLQVGISTHNDAEIAIAKSFRPAMLGFGPIFATSTKDVAHPPQGVARLREVVQTAGLPIVAIGGITDVNLAAVAATGCAYVAMIGYLDGLTTREDLQALMHRLSGNR